MSMFEDGVNFKVVEKAKSEKDVLNHEQIEIGENDMEDFYNTTLEKKDKLEKESKKSKKNKKVAEADQTETDKELNSDQNQINKTVAIGINKVRLVDKFVIKNKIKTDIVA